MMGPADGKYAADGEEPPDDSDRKSLSCELGKLDIGQSVVVIVHSARGISRFRVCVRRILEDLLDEVFFFR